MSDASTIRQRAEQEIDRKRRLLVAEVCRTWPKKLGSLELIQCLDDLSQKSVQIALTLLDASSGSQQLIADILEEYADEEANPTAAYECDQCGEMVMCSFHTILSLLAGRTWTRQRIAREAATPPSGSQGEQKKNDVETCPTCGCARTSH